MSIPDPVSAPELLDFTVTEKTWDALSEDERRDAIASTLEQVVNFGVHDVPAGRKAAYGDIIAPGEAAGMRDALLQKITANSSCGLLIRSVWRFLGASDPLLDPPYKPGMVINHLLQYAKNNDAWKAPTPDAFDPRKGDVLLIQKPGHQHILTIVDVDGDDETFTLTSIDGGQMSAKVDDGGCNCIQKRVRKLKKASLQFDDQNKVTDWIDVSQLPFTAPIVELKKGLSDDDVV